jgi:formate transporter
MQADPPPPAHHIVALAGIEGRLPLEIARKAETDGVAKAKQDAFTLIALGVLGGAFIAFGAIFSNVALAGSQEAPFGLARVVSGLVFGVGLSLVLLAGAQIFTGDVLMVMAWASRQLSTLRVARAWCLVWIGNFIGAISTAALVFLAGHHQFGGGLVGLNALQTAAAKSALPFGRALLLGILCNVLVCLAVWISLSTRLPAHRVLLTMLPVAAFAAAGFEHVVANMYFVSFGLLIKSQAAPEFWQAIHSSPERFGALSYVGLVKNLAAVTIGNFVGGAVLVAGTYWMLYLRPRDASFFSAGRPGTRTGVPNSAPPRLT